jgi:hypothetical protein
MATLILVTSAVVKVLYALLTRGHLARATRWRR